MRHEHLTDEIRENAVLFVLGALDGGEAAGFREHLAGCTVCRDETTCFIEVIDAFGDGIESKAPPASLRPRVLSVTKSAAPRASATRASLRSMLPPSLLRGASEAWAKRSPGVRSRVLHVDSTSGRVTSLIRVDPGTWVPTHRHMDVEEIYMIEGDCRIETNLVIHAGDYYRAEPGSLHARTFSEGGATFLSVALNRYIADA